MKTSIPFYHKETNSPSNCGEPLDISLSSKELNWNGILVERGTSPYFHPKDVITPNFYFAIELEYSYSWQATMGDNTIQLSTQPGDIWINPPNTPFTHNIDLPCNFLIVNISERTMYNNFSGLLPKGLQFLNNYNIQDKTIESLLQLLFLETQNSGKNGDWYLSNVLGLFANYFIRHYSNYNDLITNRTTTSLIGSDELLIINKIILSRLSNTITIDELADALNISKFHFLNEFKKIVGVTPYQHILNTKIQIAKDELLNTNKKITSIAMELGFSDSSHFSRSFKKATNISPAQFRKQS